MNLYVFLFVACANAQRIALYHLHTVSPSIRDYMTDDKEPQPSKKCLGRNDPHPYDTGIDDVYSMDVMEMCHGADFTNLILKEDHRVELDMSDCQSHPTWGLTLKGAGKNMWSKSVLLPRSQIPGVDFVYTQCRDTLKSFRGGHRTYSNLKIQPYKLPNLVLSKHSETKPNVLVLLLDSISWKRMELFLPKTFEFLQHMNAAYAFKLTSTMGHNTSPNAKVIFGNGDVFKEARGMATSLFEDYSPEHAVAKMYPYQHYRISGKNILKNYGSDITKLYFRNNVPGCMHGEFWIQQHLRYIRKFWNIYPNTRKFHISKTYGCHMPSQNKLTCAQNDVPLEHFLKHFANMYKNTYLFLMSDHGFHWRETSKFNEIVAGEYEHRNPMLYVISPKRHENLESNTQRFVTHYDVHKTLHYLLSGKQSPIGKNLITQQIPDKRSCQDVGVPKKWCNCFVKSDGKNHLHSQKGEV